MSDDAPSKPVPVLVEIKGDLRIVHTLCDHCVVGRSPECALWIVDRLMSRRHAEVHRLSDTEFRIEDLGSKFGTFVNRESVKDQPLRPGDQVFLGSTLLQFELHSSDDARVRRRQNRLACRLPVVVTIEGKSVATVATDISLGGLRVDWGESPGVGTPVALEIMFPDWKQRLVLHGHANHKPDPAGLGIRFYYQSDEEESALAEAYSRLYLQR